MKVDYLLNTYALPLFENVLTPENNNKMLMISLSQWPSKKQAFFFRGKRVSRRKGNKDGLITGYCVTFG